MTSYTVPYTGTSRTWVQDIPSFLTLLQETLHFKMFSLDQVRTVQQEPSKGPLPGTTYVFHYNQALIGPREKPWMLALGATEDGRVQELLMLPILWEQDMHDLSGLAQLIPTAEGWKDSLLIEAPSVRSGLLTPHRTLAEQVFQDQSWRLVDEVQPKPWFALCFPYQLHLIRRVILCLEQTTVSHAFLS